MEVDIPQLLQQFGLAGVAVYLMLRVDNTLKENTRVITGLYTLLQVQMGIKEDQTKNG